MPEIPLGIPVSFFEKLHNYNNYVAFVLLFVCVNVVYITDFRPKEQSTLR